MDEELSDCPGCGAAPGRLHVAYCEEEPCPACGWQRLSCGCGTTIAEPDRMPWTGLLPGALECREYGLWSKLIPDRGWVPCQADDPGAYEDINRLVAESTWDRERRRWVRILPEELSPAPDSTSVLTPPMDTV